MMKDILWFIFLCSIPLWPLIIGLLAEARELAKLGSLDDDSGGMY